MITDILKVATVIIVCIAYMLALIWIIYDFVSNMQQEIRRCRREKREAERLDRLTNTEKKDAIIIIPDNRCVFCHAIIPEGRQICPDCTAMLRGQGKGAGYAKE
jgi:hypothetical protein